MLKKLSFLATITIAFVLSGCQGSSNSNSNPTPSSNYTLTLSGPSQVYAGINGPQTEVNILVTGTAAIGTTIPPATHIAAVASSIPTGITIQYRSPDGTTSTDGCASVSSGQSCTILLTGNNTGTAGNYTLQVSASNTSTISIPVNLQFPSAMLVFGGPSENPGSTFYSLRLRNASQVPITNLAFNLPSAPTGWTINTASQTCHTGQTLAVGETCVLELVNGPNSGDTFTYQVTISGDDMENSQILNAFSPFCEYALNPIAGLFDTELTDAPYYLTNTQNIFSGVAWGPYPMAPDPTDAKAFPIAMNTAFTECALDSNGSNTQWIAQRALAAVDYWIEQKVNYCHHHTPTWLTPADYQNSANCSTDGKLVAGNNTQGEAIRWNYSGTGSETASNWQNTNRWLGMDCSDYTSLVYNFGAQFMQLTGVAQQAGQTDTTLEGITPNTQTATDTLSADTDTGYTDLHTRLVCMDGTAAIDDSDTGCATHGGFLSVGGTDGQADTTITPQLLSGLQPGDLLYFAIKAVSVPNYDYEWNAENPAVVHVVMWTGKKVGYGPNDILPSQIAPNPRCPSTSSPNGWVPQIGDYVITDSHYQGPDYRVFTTGCYYGKTLWGVRRVIDVDNSLGRRSK